MGLWSHPNAPPADPRSLRLQPCYGAPELARALLAAFVALFDDVLGDAQLTFAEFSLLNAIADLAPCSVAALAETQSDAHAASDALDALLRRKLVAFRSALPGERTRTIGPTGAGRIALYHAYPLWVRAQARAVELVGEEALFALMSATDRLRRQQPNATARDAEA